LRQRSNGPWLIVNDRPLMTPRTPIIPGMHHGRTLTFDLYLSACALGRIQTSELPTIAMRALEEGLDSPTLVRLAGCRPGERSVFELDEMWVKTLRELGKRLPGRIDAGHELKRYFAGLVASGELPPRAGAGEIAALWIELSTDLPKRKFAGESFGVAKLLGDYYSHDDVPAEDDRVHDEIDAALKAECERIAKGESGHGLDFR
jgi:hypothetical protein